MPFISEKRLRVLIEEEVSSRIGKSKKLEVVFSRYAQTPITYVREHIPVGYNFHTNLGETVQVVNIAEFLTQTLQALQSLGVEVYHEPATKSQWGFQLKGDSKKK